MKDKRCEIVQEELYLSPNADGKMKSSGEGARPSPHPGNPMRFSEIKGNE